MTCKVLPLPVSLQQQKLQFTKILIPTPTPTTSITIETNKQNCLSCQKPVLSTPESLQTGICLACRRNLSTQQQRAEAQQKTRPILPQNNTTVVITSKYFQQKRTIDQLYSSATEPKETTKVPKIPQSQTYVCEQVVNNKDNKKVCPLCQLTPRNSKQIGLCASCNKYRLNQRKNQCHNCKEFLGFADKFYLCLCSHSFCQHCISTASGEGIVVNCCTKYVKMVKMVKPKEIDQN